jgi:thioredoxin 1
MKHVTELNAASFETDVLQSPDAVLVDFYAPWCGPCKMLAPVLEQLAVEFQGRVRFAKLNVDDAGEIAGRFNITGVPTLILFRNGQPVDMIVGMASAGMLRRQLDNKVPEASVA